MSTICEEPLARPSTGAVRRATKAGYWVALAVLIIGVAVAGVWGVRSVDDANDRAAAFPRAAVPGTATIDVTEPGEQMIYFTGPGDPSATSLRLQVKDPGGAIVPTTPYSLAVNVDMAGDVGTAIATFAADEKGPYTVSSTAGGHGHAVIAVGDNVSMEVLPRVLGALALIFLSVVAAATIAIITVLRRSPQVERSHSYS